MIPITDRPFIDCLKSIELNEKLFPNSVHY